MKHRITLLGISLGYFMVLLDMTVLSVAEQDLARSLHTSVAGLQWATTAYTVVFAALLLSSGAVADRFGAHRVFRTGVAVFGAASLLCALAPTLGVLVAVRAVLGASAAACVPASLALIGRLYPDRAAHARAVALWAAVSGSAVAAGPVAGGLLVGLAGWRAIFLVNVPLAALVLAAVRGVTAPSGTRRVDAAAQFAAAATLALLTDALIAAGAGAWPHAAAALGGTVLAAAFFAGLERRSAAPVLDRRFLTRRVRAGLTVGAAANLALTGDLFVLPLLLRDHAFGPVATGLAFLPLTLPFVLLPPLTGRIVARHGPRVPILAGTTLLATGGAALALAAHAGYPALVPGLLLTGLGMPLVLPALVAAIVGAAPAGTAGATGGVLNASRQAGATLGVAALGALPAPAALGLAGLACAGAGAWFARAR
ncbi:MFS transporter [Actinomadura rayongensis]|uniref:MFS transporter n=1 Tax=Actinomadura rayongensis TaxID=1429076 RepID=A0A6I4W4X8_9ACTN|nr:MFS transporter [Actinomadura rayongensis]MXQ63256.1 MFS transporter [Actinomadura rayongensis]